jgi:hypothetical protein
MGRSLQRILF